jgi:hypothetical protein
MGALDGKVAWVTGGAIPKTHGRLDILVKSAGINIRDRTCQSVAQPLLCRRV